MYLAADFGVYIDGGARGGWLESKEAVGADVDAVWVKGLRGKHLSSSRKSSSAVVSGEDDVGCVSRAPVGGGEGAAATLFYWATPNRRHEV